MSEIFSIIVIFAVIAGIVWLRGNQKTHIELFLQSKHPKNAAEVDFWIREYDRIHYFNRY